LIFKEVGKLRGFGLRTPVHLVMPEGYPGDEVMDDVTRTLKERFSVQHSTLQMEQGTTDHACVLIPGTTGANSC
jgi:hypothetical protein